MIKLTIIAIAVVTAIAITAALAATTGQCKATAAAPSYSEGQIAPLSCDLSGKLRLL